jgi:hypothetical protein
LFVVLLSRSEVRQIARGEMIENEPRRFFILFFDSNSSTPPSAFIWRLPDDYCRFHDQGYWESRQRPASRRAGTEAPHAAVDEMSDLMGKAIPKRISDIPV